MELRNSALAEKTRYLLYSPIDFWDFTEGKTKMTLDMFADYKPHTTFTIKDMEQFPKFKVEINE